MKEAFIERFMAVARDGVIAACNLASAFLRLSKAFRWVRWSIAPNVQTLHNSEAGQSIAGTEHLGSAFSGMTAECDR